MLTGDNPAHTEVGHGGRAEHPALPHKGGMEAVSRGKETQPQGAQACDTTKLSPFSVGYREQLKSGLKSSELEESVLHSWLDPWRQITVKFMTCEKCKP